MPILNTLRLRNFRNYSRLDLTVKPGVNLLVGCNGQGKTNLLEAVYFLALLRSFRTARTKELCSWGEQSFFVGGRVTAKDDSDNGANLAVGVGRRRRMRVDGCLVGRGSEFINRFHCVVMVPEDIRLLRGPASERRKFVDILLSQSKLGYMKTLSKYKKLLRTRNAMLRSHVRFGLSAIAAFDDQIIAVGVKLTTARVSLLQQLQISVPVEWNVLAGDGAPRLGIEYESMLLRNTGTGDDEETLAAKYRRLLETSKSQDLKEGWTRAGPHRDDVALTLDNHKLSVSGSEGQCRLASLALRLAAINLLSQSSGKNEDVVVLVDDVQGELDGDRRKRFLNRVTGGAQIFLAVTEISARGVDSAWNLYRVKQGTVKAVTC